MQVDWCQNGGANSANEWGEGIYSLFLVLHNIYNEHATKWVAI